MSKKKRRKQGADVERNTPPTSAPSFVRRFLIVAGVALMVLAVWRFIGSPAAAVRNPTFSKDIAPLVYANCANCHHTGGTAPFALLTYADVSKRAEQIVKVTQSRYMPPWLPAHGYGDFEGERYLTDEQLEMLKNWVKQGHVEGDPAQLPTAPRFDGGWELGPPDLVVQMPRAYTLPAEGRDVYRNFAMPIPVVETRYVKGFEFRSGTTRIHHAFLYVDRTPASRELESSTGEPGWWKGMSALPPTAQMPSSQFTSWQPGKTPRMHDDMAWPLEGGTDLVLQLHMQPSGKPETIQPSVGFYFTDKPGSKNPNILMVRSLDMDIPPGEKAYKAHAETTLALDIDVLAILPHTHYLGTDLRAFATLPDGTRTWLMWIKNWDFNWQGDYVYKRPVFLPKGSRVEMEYTFDNSADNPRNPNHPPKRVRYGLESTDEMAEFWFQTLPHTEADRPVLDAERQQLSAADSEAFNRRKLRDDSGDIRAHLSLGKSLFVQNHVAEAEEHFRTAVKLDPNNSEAHYLLAYLLSDRPNLKECLSEFSKSVNLDRRNYEALNGLGLIFMRIGKLHEAEGALMEAARVHPNDPLIEENLAKVRKAMGK